jgi:tyrosyl-tRNA synthetase
LLLSTTRWKACGVDTDKVEIIWASEIMDNLGYWDRVLRIGRETTLNRSMRATSIMGRTQGELQSTAQLFYPIMQTNDIFHLNVDICQMGMDQRRANILGREVAPKLGLKKPVAIHHHMIISLQGAGVSSSNDPDEVMLSSKMSKSKPETCLYMHDSEADLKRKIGKAYCPERIIEGNPIIDYCEHLIFKKYNTMLIERSAKFGGNLEIQGIAELKKVYEEGKLHPMDLKNTTAKYLNEMIAPAREHFEKNKKAKELYETVKQYAITR